MSDRENSSDLNLASLGLELPQPSIIVHSSSSVCACSELSFEGPAEGVRGCTQGGRPPPPIVVDNEPAQQLPGILHTTRSAVLCRTVTMKADDCRKVDSGSNVLEIQEARDIANSLSHKHESVRPGMPGEWSFQVRKVPPPATVPSGVTISWGGNTTDVVHRQADDMLAAEKTGPQSAAHHDEVNQGNVGDQKPTSLNWTSPASEINTDVNTKKLPDRPGASVTSYHTTGEKVPGSKIQDVQEELKDQVSSARSPDSIHLESRIQETTSAAKVTSKEDIYIEDFENSGAKSAARTTSRAGEFEISKTDPIQKWNQSSPARDALKPALNIVNTQVPATSSKTFHAVGTPKTFVPSVVTVKKMTVAVRGDQDKLQNPESSSSGSWRPSAQAGDIQVDQDLQVFEERETAVSFTNDGSSYGLSNRFTSGELSVAFAPTYNGAAAWDTEAKPVLNGKQQLQQDLSESLLQNPQAGIFHPHLPRQNTAASFKQFHRQFNYNERCGDQEWMPYSGYTVPQERSGTKFGATEPGPLKPYFTTPTVPAQMHRVRNPQMQAVVATATGEFHVPRGMRAPRRSPAHSWRSPPYPQLMTPSNYRMMRYGYRASAHGLPESRNPRAAVSAQYTRRIRTNYGQTKKRNFYPNTGMTQPLQHRVMSPTFPGVQYWDNTPYLVTSWHGGYYGAVNPEGSPFSFRTSQRPPSAEVSSRQPMRLDRRIAGRKLLLQSGSLSTFDSHGNVDEPAKLTQRTSVPLKNWPSPSEQRATSTKKVQTEPRHTSATRSTVTDITGPKIITPRVKKHVDIDDSYTDLRHTPYTHATTQTEHFVPPWTTTSSPQQQNLGDAIHFHAFCGGTPNPRYINQNVVCPQYPPYIQPNLQTPAPVQFIPSAESHLPPSVAQNPYYATTQLQGNRDVNQRVVVPKKTRSSPERGAACPLSSCFRGVSHCDDYDSEEKPRKPRRCHHHAGRRGKSPLPPPFALGSKFSVGYVMNSENELNPVLVPLNAPTVPPATSAARSAGIVTVAVQSHVASSSSMTEEDPVAELQVRVQKQLAHIEKAIKEQDMRRKEEAKKRDKSRDNKLNEDKRAKELRNKTTGGSNHGKKPHSIGNAETPERSSSSDSQTVPSSWFSWSRTSKRRKGENHSIAHKQLMTSVSSMGKEPDDKSGSYHTSKEKATKRRERTAVAGASSSEASRDHPTFSWSTRGKATENGNIHSSGEAFGDRPTFTWTTRKKAGQDRSVQSSPRGSIFQKEYSTHERKRSPPRLAAKSCDTSPNDSPKRRNTTSPQRSPGRTTAESAWRTRPHKNSSSPVRSELSAELPHSYEADPRADASLLANARVALPGDKRTQRRWSRTEMHRSTSYDTAASSVAPSSTKERRTRSEEQFKVQRSPKPKSNTPTSWWASMCNLFKGPNQPESPSPKTRRLSAEDSTERSDAAEKKAGSGGGMLSGIFNWFPSRSADKPKKARRRSAGSKEDSSSSFKEWITEKERALKKAQAKLNARKNKAQKRQASAAEGESEIPEDPYFVDDGGSRWAIRSSPSHSESASHSPKYESATVEVVTPYMPPGPSTYGAPVSLVRCTFGDSRERPTAVPFQQQSGFAPSADQDWSLQYIYGGPGAEVPVTRPPEGNPTPPVADSNVPPLYTFRDEPDWVLRITQGRERSKSSVGSATSQRAYPRKSSLSAEWKMEEPSFTARPTEVQSGQRKGSITASLSERPKKKRSSVSFEEDKEGGTPSQSKPHEAPEKSTYTQESAQPLPAVATHMAPAIAPAPVPPLGFNTEESFKHEFYEEMDERGRAALSAPAYERRSSIHETTASAAAKMAAIDALFNSRSGKTPDITGEYGSASTAAYHPLSRIAPQPEKCSGLAGSQRTSLKPPDSFGTEPPQPPTPEKRTGVAKAGRRSSAPETASAAAAETNAENKNKDANDEQFKAAAFARLAPGDPTHTNYVVQQRTPRKLQLNGPLSHKCPTVQEVAGYAIIATVVLLGLLLLVSVPKMRFHAMGMQG